MAGQGVIRASDGTAMARANPWLELNFDGSAGPLADTARFCALSSPATP